MIPVLPVSGQFSPIPKFTKHKKHMKYIYENEEFEITFLTVRQKTGPVKTCIFCVVLFLMSKYNPKYVFR